MTVFILIVNSDVFFTALLQYFILGQSIATSEIMAMIGCYFGIIIMVYYTSDTSPSYSLTLGVVWSLIAAASIAVGSILIYKMRELHYTVVVFWQGIFCVGFFGMFWCYELVYYGKMPYESHGDEPQWYYAEMIVAALAAVFANTLLTICYANENPTTVAVLSQL